MVAVAVSGAGAVGVDVQQVKVKHAGTPLTNWNLPPAPHGENSIGSRLIPRTAEI